MSVTSAVSLKVLYLAHRLDPRNPASGSGADYQLYNALKDNGATVKLVGPFVQPAFVGERVLKVIYQKLRNKRYTKFPVSVMLREAYTLRQFDRHWKPDVIFTMFPSALALYSGETPCVLRADATYLAATCEYVHPDALPWGRFFLKHTIWTQVQALKKSAAIVTHSHWCKEAMIRDHKIASQKIVVFPNPAAISHKAVTEFWENSSIKSLSYPLQLLLVGRDNHRKGVDIAIEIVTQLNSKGMPAVLTVCGVQGIDSEYIKYVGPYQKTDSHELHKYMELFQRAHLLLHPARFDPSPIVTSEAAAFGTPTITNNTGGLATSVQNGVSGVVLPAGVPASAYVDSIIALISSPRDYYALCHSTRERYQKELNWDRAGKHLMQVLMAVVNNRVGIYPN